MTIFRRKFEMETIGSREEANLRPKLSNDLSQGLNYRVYSYDEVKGTCIVEVWCSNHKILPAKHRKNEADLKALDSLGYIKKVLPNTPKKPEILGTLSISDYVENIGKKGKRIGQVKRMEKKILVGMSAPKEIGYLRSKKSRDTIGREIEEFVLDEG